MCSLSTGMLTVSRMMSRWFVRMQTLPVERLNCLTSQSLGMITLPHCPATSEKDLEDHSCRGSPEMAIQVTRHLSDLNGAEFVIKINCSSILHEICLLNGLITLLHYQYGDNLFLKAINLDNELRSIKIGKMTVNEYCTKIKSMADRLKNLSCVVSEKNFVIYTVDGLDSRFATLVKII
nr:hybrid signal transduction histidine kinase M [Tanacetum cinerariifolium]